MHKKKIRKQTIEDHLKNTIPSLKELFNSIESKILELDEVQEKVRGNYIGYWFAPANKKPRLFIEVHIQNAKIKLHLGRLEYKNNTGIIMKDAPDTHKWTLTKLVDVYIESDLDAVMKLIKQSYTMLHEI
jgi:predicted transport protein